MKFSLETKVTAFIGHISTLTSLILGLLAGKGIDLHLIIGVTVTIFLCINMLVLSIIMFGEGK